VKAVTIMTPVEREVLDALNGVRFERGEQGDTEGTFVACIAARACLTDRQRGWMWKLVWKYREQMILDAATVEYARLESLRWKSENRGGRKR